MEPKFDVVALGELLIDFTMNGESEQGNPLFEANPGADMMLTAAELPAELITQTKIFHFGTLSLTREPVRSATQTALELAKEKHILIFLLAFFFYIDGVYTVIDMATAYGQALGLDTNALLLALLVTQIVAFPCVLIFSRIVKRIRPETIITVCIAAYFFIAVYAYWLDSEFDFWLLAVMVGMFQGTIQALSRSYFAKIIPAEKSGEFFGIYDICGKGASVIGTALVSFLSQLTGSINIGVSALSVMFLIGLILFRFSAKLNIDSKKV